MMIAKIHRNTDLGQIMERYENILAHDITQTVVSHNFNTIATEAETAKLFKPLTDKWGFQGVVFPVFLSEVIETEEIKKISKSALAQLGAGDEETKNSPKYQLAQRLAIGRDLFDTITDMILSIAKHVMGKCGCDAEAREKISDGLQGFLLTGQIPEDVKHGRC